MHWLNDLIDLLGFIKGCIITNKIIAVSLLETTLEKTLSQVYARGTDFILEKLHNCHNTNIVKSYT